MLLNLDFQISEGIGPRSAGKSQGNPNEDAKTEKAVGSGKATLRLKSKGPPVLENVEVSIRNYRNHEGRDKNIFILKLEL
jgi:hypothetical protein